MRKSSQHQNEELNPQKQQQHRQKKEKREIENASRNRDPDSYNSCGIVYCMS